MQDDDLFILVSRCGHLVRTSIADCCQSRHLFHTFVASICPTFNRLENNFDEKPHAGRKCPCFRTCKVVFTLTRNAWQTISTD